MRTSAANVSEGDLTHGARGDPGLLRHDRHRREGRRDLRRRRLPRRVAGERRPAADRRRPARPGGLRRRGLGDARDRARSRAGRGARLRHRRSRPRRSSRRTSSISRPAGCNIIVDDVIYLDESPFEDGPVAQAVNTVTADGVLYFSSAGNEGNVDDGTSGTWEGDFLASAAPDPALSPEPNLHDFGDGGNSILVEFGGGNPPLLIWAEHYDLEHGHRVDRLRHLRHGRRAHDDLRRQHGRPGRHWRRRLSDRVHRRRHLRR